MYLTGMLVQFLKDAALVMALGGLAAAVVAWACVVTGGRSEKR